MNDLILRTAGYEHGGWKSMDVFLSMEQMADTFSLSVTEKWKGQKERRSIKKGSPSTIEIDSELVMTGYVGEVSPTYDATTHMISVNGDSRTIDLVECSADTFQWSGLTLAQGAQKLCEPYGITVIDEVGDTQVFDSLKGDAGAKISDVLMEAAHIRACLLMSTPDGNLRITRAAAGPAVAKLELGVNAVQCTGNESAHDLFSLLKILEQNPGTDFDSASDSAAVQAETTDPSVGRFRQLIIDGEYPMDAAQAKQRIENERNVRWGRSQRCTYTVRGWRNSDNKLWLPNTMVQVEDAYADIHDLRIVSGVRLICDDQGKYAQITVVPRETFEMLPLPEPNTAGGF